MAAVIGVGPIVLSVILTAGFYDVSHIIVIDLDANRLELAEKFGAINAVNSDESDWKDQVIAMTDGVGLHTAVEAVGIPETLNNCADLMRPGGTAANEEVHGFPVELAIKDL